MRKVTIPGRGLKYAQRTKSNLIFEGQKVLRFLNDIEDGVSRVLSARPKLVFTLFRKTTSDRILNKRIVSSIALIFFVAGIAGLAALVQAPPAHATTCTVTFMQTGVGADFTGTVVTVGGTGYTVTDLGTAGKAFAWQCSSVHKFAFQSPLVVTPNVERYAWTSTSGLSTAQSDNAFTVTGSGSITGNYVTQYRIRFDQVGVGGNFTGTVLVVDGTNNLDVSSLPHPFWWDNASVHSFAFQSPLVVAVDVEQYVWTKTSGGLSTAQSDNAFTVTGSGSITGHYETQYYLTMSANFGTVSPVSSWQDAGSKVTITATAPDAGAGEQYVWNGWAGNGDVSYSGMDNPATDAVNMNGPISEAASWNHQYLTTVSSTASTTVVDSTSSGTSTSETSSSTTTDSETSTTITTVNPVLVTGTSWATTTVTGTTPGTTTTTMTSAQTTSTVVSSLSQESSSSVSTETLTSTTSIESNTIETSTETSLTTSTTTSGGTVTEFVNETDTIHAYLLLVYDELHTFVEHVTNFLTDVFHQTETPLGVQVNKVIVTQPSVSRVLAKSTDGTELHVKVIVDWNYWNPQTTPFSMPPMGKHTFTAPWITSTGGVTYNFQRWEDEAGVVVSRSPTFTYNLQSAKTFTAIYAKPSYTLTVYASDSRTHRPIVGASVTLDGVKVGSTDSYGRLVIQGVSAGNHQLIISKTGYKDYTATINITSNRTLYANLNRI